VREGNVLRYRWTGDAAPTDNAVLLPTGWAATVSGHTGVFGIGGSRRGEP